MRYIYVTSEFKAALLGAISGMELLIALFCIFIGITNNNTISTVLGGAGLVVSLLVFKIATTQEDSK